MTNPSKQLEDIKAMIVEARDAVNDGSSIDMTEIQELVKEVCEAIQKYPPKDGERVNNKITHIITNLNFLVEELNVQQKQAGGKTIEKGYKKNQDRT